MRIVVTEVTDFGSSRHCVAGWCPATRLMVRPEPAPIAFWQRQYVSPQLFWPGNEVEFDGLKPHPATPLPHFTEDSVVQLPSLRFVRTLPAPEFVEMLAQTTSARVTQIFDGFLADGAKPFVVPGSNCKSLGGLTVPAAQVQFYADQFEDKPVKLRAMVFDGERHYDLSITSNEMRNIFRGGGTAGVIQHFAGAAELHLRIGLAREFPAGRCHAQINQVIRVS